MRVDTSKGFNREDWNREADRNAFLPHYELELGRSMCRA